MAFSGKIPESDLRNKLDHNSSLFINIQNMWDYASSNLHPYQYGNTRQDGSHCQNVENNMCKLISDLDIQLSQEEIYYLSASACLHDIGKINTIDGLKNEVEDALIKSMDNADVSKAYKKEKETSKRKKILKEAIEKYIIVQDHGEVGAKMLPFLEERNLLSRNHLPNLQALTKFHSSQNIGVLENREKFEPKIYLLGLLLLLADTLDTTSERARKIPYILTNVDLGNNFVVNARYAIEKWEIAKNNEIVIYSTPQNAFEYECVREMVKSLNNDLYSSYKKLIELKLPFTLKLNIDTSNLSKEELSEIDINDGEKVDDIESKIKSYAKCCLKQEDKSPYIDAITKPKYIDTIKILRRSKKKILVVGDVMLDHLMYCYGTQFLQSCQHNVSEDYSFCHQEDNIYPEEVKRLGGAANIAYCCSVLSEVILFGVIGEDSYGDDLLNETIKTKNILQELVKIRDYITIAKIYYNIRENVGDIKAWKKIRINREYNETIGMDILSRHKDLLLDHFRRIFTKDVDCIVFKDHEKGFLTKEFLEEIKHDINARISTKKDFLVIVDPKYDWRKFTVFDKIHAIIPNVKEAASGIFHQDTLDGIITREGAIRERTKDSSLKLGDLELLNEKYPMIDTFIIKKDEKGGLFYRPSSKICYTIDTFKKKGDIDGEIGCGDAFDAYLIHCLLNRKELNQKEIKEDMFLRLANVAAGIKLGMPTSEHITLKDIDHELDLNTFI